MGDPSDVFKAYDIRGTYPDQIDAALCRAIGAAAATFSGADRLLVVRDMRPSGVELARAFAEGARRVGTRVTDLGMASTDFLYYASGVLDAPGAMFTASHNPAQYNGIKLCGAGARPIGRDTGLKEIERLAVGFLKEPPPAGDEAPLDHAELLEDYAAHVRSFVDTSVLRPLKVVADTANGMGGLVAPIVCKPLPFDLTVLFGELDGTFPNHPADPIQPENQADLKRAVVDLGADVGLAFDGDAARACFAAELRGPIPGSLTPALAPRSLLEQHPGATVLYNLICSKVVPEVIAEAGGTGVRTRVGHSFIKATMAETKATFGGEHSGHYYFADNYRADSGIIAAMVVLELMSKSAKPLSELIAPLRRYADSGEINTEVHDPVAAVEAVAEHVAAQGTGIDRLDGLTVDHGDWWYNLRPSNTEPLLRLNVEAPDEAACARHVDEVLALVTRLTS
ncbi:MAG: phosphomannomutase/phosphoglucomutase [Acidimicrobiales bacterium]